MTEQQYIEAHFSMFGGPDESVIECQKVAIVTVRQRHRCMCPGHGNRVHVIQCGERAVRDSAKVDGQFGSCYVCLPCLASWNAHIMLPHKDYCTVESQKETKGSEGA